jgi:hypothetical protein
MRHACFRCIFVFVLLLTSYQLRAAGHVLFRTAIICLARTRCHVQPARLLVSLTWWPMPGVIVFTYTTAGTGSPISSMVMSTRQYEQVME